MTRSILLIGWISLAGTNFSGAVSADNRPNILLAISDDQSFCHTSIAGCQAVETPAFDRVAREALERVVLDAICLLRELEPHEPVLRKVVGGVGGPVGAAGPRRLDEDGWQH